MASSNLSVLERNMLAGIQREDSEAIFLRGVDRDRRRAERCAWEWDIIAEAVEPMLAAALRLRGATTDHGVFAFVRERHFHRHFPNTGRGL